MVKNCCVSTCSTVWNPYADISLFNFPWKRNTLLQEWIKIIPTNCKITKNSRICSLHFHNELVEQKYGKRILKKDAIPTIFANEKRILQLQDRNKVAHSETCGQINDNVADLQTEKRQGVQSLSRDEIIKIEDFENIEQDHALLQTRQVENMVIDNHSSSPRQMEMKSVGTQVSPHRLKPSMRIAHMQREIRFLRNQLRRRDKKILTMSQLIKELKQSGTSSDALEEILISKFSDFNLELFKHQAKNSALGKSKRSYSDTMKDFASTLYFYSPRAYAYIRKKIVALPHESTLRTWVAEYSCEAGFISGVFEFLKVERLKSEYVRDVALIIDGMAIRSQLAVDNKENIVRGYVDYGPEAKDLNLKFNTMDFAKEMLAFQIVSFTTKFKIPIAHFFVKGINAKNQSILIITAIKKLYDVGIIVRSLTCDATKCNFSTMKMLGCDFSPKTIKTSFKHPCNESDIHAIIDPCHAIKIARNAFFETGITTPVGITSSKYVVKLHEIQDAEGFKFANRLSRAHVEFANKKMKVSLAAQVISSSVADAIDYLRESGHPDFNNSEATTYFIRTIDKLFDMMNSRNAYGRGFKSPLSPSNLDHWTQVFQNSEDYIRSLKIDGKSLLQHERKFGLSFLIDIRSFKNLALDLFAKENPLKYFLTYKCSQDHIELYFCCLRSCGGWNNNPTIMQILWAVRRLLYRNSVKPSLNANCLSEEFELSPVFEFRAKKRSIGTPDDPENNNDPELDTLLESLDNVDLSHYQENILYYIAGNVVRKFVEKCQCVHCKEIVVSHPQEKDHTYSSVDFLQYSGFLQFVNRGKLVIPSTGIYKIVKFCEKCLQMEIIAGFMGTDNMKKRIVCLAVKHFLPSIKSLFHPEHPIVETVNQCDELHEIKIIKYIASRYTIIRLHAITKKKTLDYLGDKATLRQKLNKTVLFYNV